MKLLASALILAGLSFADPAHASSNGRAAPQAGSVPEAKPEHDSAASCPCPKRIERVTAKRVERVTHDATATRRDPGRR